jgi:hypothetical protein
VRINKYGMNKYGRRGRTGGVGEEEEKQKKKRKKSTKNNSTASANVWGYRLPRYQDVIIPVTVRW